MKKSELKALLKVITEEVVSMNNENAAPEANIPAEHQALWKEYQRRLTLHDWYNAYSDDPRAWREAAQDMAQINQMRYKLEQAGLGELAADAMKNAVPWKKQVSESKGLSGFKKSKESTEHTEKIASSKDLTGAAPKEKEEGKKLPVVKKPATPQKVGSIKEEIMTMIREALDAHRMEEPSQNINQQIADLLKGGKKVYSSAIGRVGEIVRADGNKVYIKLKDGKTGVTSFNRGDEVKLEDEEGGRVVVVNSRGLEEMARVKGAVGSKFKVQDPSSPTGWVVKGHKTIPDGTPTEAPKGPYVPKGTNPNMGRPKKADAAPVDGKGSDAGTRDEIENILTAAPETSDEDIISQLSSNEEGGFNTDPAFIKKTADELRKELGADKSSGAEDAPEADLAAMASAEERKKAAQRAAWIKKLMAKRQK